MLWRLTSGSLRDGLLYLSNSYCLPGRAGGSPNGLGESLDSVQAFSAPLIEATTVSLEALKVYSQGLAERQAKGSLEGIPYMKRAVDIDPNFALAYNRLGAMYANMSQWDLAIESFRRAYQLRSRVSEREKFYIESDYFRYVLDESDNATRVCEDWTRSYPNDSIPHSRLGLLYLGLGQFEKQLKSSRYPCGWVLIRRIPPDVFIYLIGQV